MSPHITMDIEGGVASIVMNRPEARNALSEELRAGLAEFMEQCEMDEAIRCVVLRGAGGHFMGGGDVKGFKERENMAPAKRKAMVVRLLHTLHYAIHRMRGMPKPVICAVEGAAAGAGVSLAVAGDLTIAAESAFFTLAYARIGLNPDASSTYFLPRMIGLKRTFEMMYSADRYTAEEAREMGLVTRVVPDDEFDNYVAELAARLADGPTYAYGRGKALLNASFENSMESQLELESYAIGDCMMTDDHIEGITAFVEKRAPIFKGK